MNQPEEEQRVIAAHEAGHLVLHRRQLKAGAMSDFDVCNRTSRLEREANFFAADFLISDEEVLDLIHSSDADYFDASKTLKVPSPFLGFKLYSMLNRGCSVSIPQDLNSTFLKQETVRLVRR